MVRRGLLVRQGQTGTRSYGSEGKKARARADILGGFPLHFASGDPNITLTMSENVTTAAKRTPMPQGTSNKPGETTKPRIGRPPAKINEKKVAELALCGVTDNGIATLLGVDRETIKSRFSELCRKNRIRRKLAIRKRQMKILLSVDKWGQPTRGAATMAVWLGKQELGQTDRAEISGDVSINITIEDYDPGAPAGDDTGNGDGDGG